MSNKKSKKQETAATDVTAEMLFKPTGTHNTAHNARNVGGQSFGHVNSAGRSMSGRTSDTDVTVQARKAGKSSK